MGRNLVVALLFCVPPVMAQDGGTTARATSPFMVDTHLLSLQWSTSAPNVTPVWVDSRGRMVAFTNQGAPLFHCFSTDAGVPAPLSSGYLLDPLPAGTPNETMGARPGSDVFTVTQTDGKVFRASCGAVAQQLGTYVPPAALAPPMNSVHPIDSTGAMYYFVQAGLAKLAITPGLAASLVTPIEDIRAAVGLAPPDGGLEDGTLLPSGLTITPSGHLFFYVAFTTPTPAPTGIRPVWILRRAPSGTLSIVWSGEGYGGSVSGAWDPTSNSVLLDGPRPSLIPEVPNRLLAVFPEDPPAALATQPRAFPRRPSFSLAANSSLQPLVRLVGGSSRAYALAALQQGGDDLLYSVRLDRALADFDRDGLRATDEARLGTSDYVADSDGDGVTDDWELSMTLTSPLDAGSVVPPVAVDGTVLAPTLFPNTWKEGRSARDYTWAPVICILGKCLDPEFQPLPNTSSVVGQARVPWPPRGQRANTIHHLSVAGQGWSSRNLATGVESPFLSPDPLLPQGYTWGLVSLDENTALMNNSGSLWRVSSTGALPFAVFDPARVGCEILSGPADLSRCGVERELATPDISDFEIVGFDPDLKMVLLRVSTYDAQFLLGIDATRVVRLANLTTEAYGFTVTGVVPMSLAGSQGYLVTAGAALPTTSLGATVRFDSAFRRVDSPQPVLDGKQGLTPFFRRGFIGFAGSHYLHEPLPAGGGECGGAGGVFSCDGEGTPPPFYLAYSWLAEWVPVGPALEKGEVLYWSGLRHWMSRGLVREPLTGQYVARDQLGDWNLWRTTPSGATTEWLRRPQFIARLNASDLAEVVARPLGEVTAIGISSDGLKICLAELAEKRVWELELDPVARTLTRISLASRTVGAGCAYDEAGTLATLGMNPAVVQVGSRSLPVASVTAPIGLYRMGGRFVVQADHAPAACVADDGTVSELAVRVIAISTAPGGVAYIDGEGNGFTNTVDRFCSGAPPAEIFQRVMARRVVAGVVTGTSDLKVFERLYNPQFTYRPVKAYRAVLAVRPDGMVLASMAEQVGENGVRDNTEAVPNVVFYYFPTYEVLSLALPEHDSFRITEVVHDVVATQPFQVTAMAVVPGAPTIRDWGYVTRPGVRAEIIQPVPDAGTVEPPPIPEPPKPGCGCGSPGPVLVLVAMMWARRRQRRVTASAGPR